ncbi:hypothetical protein AVEN_119628-1 [Araneus ventricosus]|uniref:Uncharacterized protein n=1 Tax=Araneus ventricosus TaxID=182803 RepID=A0A4Y2WEB9_ARAVE|nr:hypothetical protein AVEN_119628-1 [Araneus ventricosus]
MEAVTPIPWGYCAYSSSRFQNRIRFLLALGTTFCGFPFCERASLPFLWSHFSIMTQHSKWITNEDENPNFSTSPRPFSSDFCIDDGFWSGALQIALSGLSVNVQL